MNLKNFPKRLDSKTSSLRITVPENLDLALEGLIRKVLREQPKTDDIYSFAADYFESLLKIRDRADLKFTASQLCPFHNDEDAHEMIKLARTFARPIPEKQKVKSKEAVQAKINKTEKKREIDNKKNVRRPKPKETLKDKEPVVESKQTTPDLIKILPEMTKPTETEKCDGNLEPKLNVEENEEEFLTSDPIKELVEKELMIKTNSSEDKTDKTVKTAGNNDSQSITIQKTEKRDSSNYKTNESGTNENTTDKERLMEERKQEDTDNTQKVEVDENNIVPDKLSKDTEKTGNEELRTEDLEGANTEKTNDVEGEKVDEMIETNQKSTANAADTSKENTKAEQTNEESIKDAEETKVTPEKVTLQSETEAILTKIQQVDEKGQKKDEIRKNSTEKDDNVKTESNTDMLPKYESEFSGEDKNKVNLIEKSNQNQTEDVFATELEEGKTEKTAEIFSTEKTPTEVEIGNDIKTTQQPTDDKQTETELKSAQESTAEKILPIETPDTKSVDITKAESDKNEEKKEEKNPANILLGSATNNEESLTEPVKEYEEKKDLEETAEVTNNLEIKNLNEKQLEVSEKPEEKSAHEAESLQKVFDNKKDKEINQKEEGQTAYEDIKTLDPEQSVDKTVKEETETEEVKPTPVEATSTHENRLVSEPIADLSNKEKDKLESAQVQPDEGLESSEQQPEKLKEEKISENKKLLDEETKKEDKGNKYEDSGEASQNVESEIPQTESKIETQKDDQDVSPDAAESQSTAMKDSENENGSEEELCKVIDIQNIPNEKIEQEQKEKLEHIEAKELKTRPEVPKYENKEDKADTKELFRVEEAQQTLKQEEIHRKSVEKELTEAENLPTEESAIETVVEHLSPSEEDQKNIKKCAVEQEPNIDNIQNMEEICTVVDIEHVPKEDKTESAKPTEDLKIEPATERNKNESGTKSEAPTSVDTVIKVEENKEKSENKEETSEVPQQSGEIQVKTIQTHLYDTLQVPETVKKEYRVHSVTAGIGLLDVANLVHQGYNEVQQSSNATGRVREILDENMNSTTEFVKTVNISLPTEETTEAADTSQPVDIEQTVKTTTSPLADVIKQQDPEDSDDLLDIMTPTSGYSLNLSELSWQTVNGLFLENEKRYSSLEKEEPRYAASKINDTTKQENRPEVQEVIEKTIVQSHVEAVPDPPRDLEEIQQETNLLVKEKADECEKQKLDERENSESESSEGSKDNELPVVLVEVKTVIETQVLEEEEKNGELPDVEVQVEATIDLQQADLKKTSDGESQQKVDVQSSLEESQNQSERTKDSCSTEPTAGREGSSGESDSTISSGATEIKRADFAKRSLSSARSLLSTQSLDLGKRNPLVKTGSLTTFRHGVTDFEVWNKIEKELEEAATKIQSKYRGYKTRKKLQRENAVQITTEESSISTTPVEAEAKDECQQQSTGEFHDSIVLSEHPR